MTMYSGEEYYHKADNLIRISCQAAQNVFRDRWKRYTGNEWTEESAHEFIEDMGKTFYSSQKRIQKQLLDEGNLEKWDFGILSGIMKSLKPLVISKEDQEIFKIDNLVLQELCTVRNQLAHSAIKKLNCTEYQETEDKIRECLSKLGIYQEKIDKQIAHAGVTSSVAALEQAKKISILADHAFSNGQIQEAIKSYEEALLVPSLLPVNLSTLYEKKARCYLNLGKGETDQATIQNAHLDQAMMDIKQALDFNESSWKAHSTIASIYKAKNDMEKAIEHFTRALAISPGQMEVKVELAICKLLNGQMAREEHFDRSTMLRTVEEIIAFNSKLAGIKIDSDKHFKNQHLLDKYKSGHSYAQTGHQYAQGWKVPQNYQEAARHYTKAMELNNSEGIFGLAILYMDGKGVKRNIPRAINLLNRAAGMPEKTLLLGKWHVEMGVRAAQYHLGLKFEEGIGLSRDYAQAAEWYTKAAINGCGKSANNLALLYYNGKGVTKDLEMAERFWKRSLEMGNSTAAFSLCIYYINEMEPAMARQMLRQAESLRHPQLPRIKADMEKRIQSMAEMRKSMESHLIKFERDRCLSTKNLTFRQKHDCMFIIAVHEKILEANGNQQADETAERLAKLLKSNPFAFFRTQNDHIFGNDNSLKWAGKFEACDVKEIVKRATEEKEGSVTAKRILATMGYNDYFLLLWNGGPPFSDRMAKTLVDFIYLRVCMEHQIFYVKSMEMLEEFYAFLASMFEVHCNQKGEMDKKVRLCYALHFMEKVELKFIVEVLKEGILRYPDEPFYYLFLSDMYDFMNENELGLQVACQGLKQFPKFDKLLHCKAVHTRLAEGKSPEEIRKAYQDFIEVAPKDHRQIPDAYYCIAISYTESIDPRNCQGELNVETMGIIRKYYELGQQAEKIQLPCYLPYETPAKTMLEPLLLVNDSSLGNENGVKGAAAGRTNKMAKSANLPKVATKSCRDYLKDPKRIELVKAHREDQMEMEKLQKWQTTHVMIDISLTEQPTLQHRLPNNLCNMKEITLKKMNPTKDKQYKKKVLNLISIGEPIFGMSSISLVAMDDNKDTTRLFIYNVPQNEESRGKLALGCRLAIINPYMRIGARDLKNGIRVDEPKCIVYGDKIENMCSYCSEENARNKCSRCKRAWYCSTECQVADWKELKHKLICKPNAN